jgi:hypothetical protein
MAGTRRASALGAGIRGAGSGFETARAVFDFAGGGSAGGRATSSVGSVGAGAIGVGAGRLTSGRGSMTVVLSLTAGLWRAE